MHNFYNFTKCKIPKYYSNKPLNINNMQTIERKKIENVRYLFGSPSTVKSRHNQLIRTFSEAEDLKIFSAPVFDEATNSIIWTTDFNGTIINFAKLSPTDQAVAKKLLSKSIQQIIQKAKSFNNNEILEFVYNCIEIPSLNNIYLIRDNSEDNVVITEWGFVSDIPGMEKGLLAKIISIKRADMIFNVIYKGTDEPAPNENFYFEFEEHTEQHASNQEGIIILKDVKVDETVTVYQKEKNEILNKTQFICYEGGKYKLEVEKKINMRFKVLDEQDNTVQGITFLFSYDGNQVNLTSDAEGKIILNNIKKGTEVSVKSNSEQADIYNFICEDERENILRIKKKTYDMRIKIVDKNNEIVPNAKVTIKTGKTKKIYYSDENGFVILKNVEPNTKFDVVAIGKKQRKKKETEKK